MAMTFGCMEKGKGVSSRANILISVKVLVGNTVSSVHHAKAVSSGYPLKKKENKEKNKGKKGLGKICIHDGYNSPSTKAPTGNIMHTYLSLYPHVWTSPSHITSLTWIG
jgi:hypothetical protein